MVATLAAGLAVAGCRGPSGRAASGDAAGDAASDSAIRVAAPPGVRVESRLTAYPVRGATNDAIARDMARSAPVVAGRRYPAATRWHVRWSYAFDRGRGAGSCGLRDVRADVDARVDYPTPAAAPDDAALARWWAAYQARLLAHERGHVRIAVDAAGAVVARLRPLAGASCEALRALADGAAAELLERARAREAAYDVETCHGTRATTALRDGAPHPSPCPGDPPDRPPVRPHA